MPARPRQNLAGGHVVQLKLVGDLRQRPALDGGLPEDAPLALGELLEDAVDHIAVDDRRLRIPFRVTIGPKRIDGGVESLLTPNLVKAVVAGDGQEPRARWDGTCVGGPEKDLLAGIRG